MCTSFLIPYQSDAVVRGGSEVDPEDEDIVFVDLGTVLSEVLINDVIRC